MSQDNEPPFEEEADELLEKVMLVESAQAMAAIRGMIAEERLHVIAAWDDGTGKLDYRPVLRAYHNGLCIDLWLIQAPKEEESE